MSSGLQRRRVPGGGSSSTGGSSEPVSSTGAQDSPNENGAKFAYDPLDITSNEYEVKSPKLTLMEEVLLMGLKDKQVRINR
jgi:Golgi phosphoprotein 3